MTLGLFKVYAQSNPIIDNKIVVMKEIERITEIHEPIKWGIEEKSLYFGYSSYGIPWIKTALHGVSLGISYNHLMVDVDFGFGSLIKENAYDNTEAFDYLKSHSTQGFAFLSAQYYPIKYFSFGAGLGFHTELQKEISSQTSHQDHYSIETDKITFNNKGYFGLRLKAAIYLPVTHMVSIYLSTSYDIMPSDTRKNKLDLGLGLKIAID